MGDLVFYYGSMNCGKSTRLMMEKHNYSEQGKEVIVFKPSTDTKSNGLIHSRVLNEECVAVEVDPTSYNFMFEMVLSYRPDCILIDEVQFFPKHQIDEIVKISDFMEVEIHCYGLMTDFQTNLFEGSKRLIEVGARLEEMSVSCFECNSKAVYNMRLVDGKPVFEGEQLQIGGNESYRSVCRRCYERSKSLSSAFTDKTNKGVVIP